MKTLLVFPPFYLRSLYNLPPLGLLNLASVLGEAGHKVSVLDLVLAFRRGELPRNATIYQAAARMIEREEPDVVAFSLQCATAPAAVQIARLLRERKPETRIIVGGHDVSFVAGRFLDRFSWIDAVVRGEGEITLRELVSAYRDGGDAEAIDGVSWRRGREIVHNPDRKLIGDLDQLPLPDYSLVPGLDVYRDACGIPRSIAIIEVGRGCPHSCVYCSESVLWQRRSRTFSLPRIMNEMRRLRDGFGAECFLFAYDQFTADRGMVEQFCRGVIEQGLAGTPWYCISRLDSVDPPLLARMREAGCESMCYGIDSGSHRTLSFIGKKIDTDILYRRVRETTEKGMVPTLSFVIGFPEETREDIDMTLSLALMTGIQGNSNPLMQMPTVLPGTELHRRYADRLRRVEDTYFSLGLEFDNGRRLEEDTRLIESDPLIFSGFFNLPCLGLSLSEIGRLTGFFPFIVNLFPKSFLLLGRALGESISSLFSRFLSHVAMAEGRDTPSLTPEDCPRHFPFFARTVLEQAEVDAWRHLSEVLDYESLMLQVASFAPRAPGTADLCLLSEWLPVKSDSIALGEFRYNLPEIISDLKSGNIRESYREEPTLLVFAAGENGVEVVEINEFGRDLVRICNGAVTVEEIAEQLRPRFGSKMKREDFLEECRQALRILGDMKLVHPTPSQVEARKEVRTC